MKALYGVIAAVLGVLAFAVVTYAGKSPLKPIGKLGNVMAIKSTPDPGGRGTWIEVRGSQGVLELAVQKTGKVRYSASKDGYVSPQDMWRMQTQ